MSKNDGGPAFPGAVDHAAPTGMTLRDWYAGQALAGICSNPEESKRCRNLSVSKQLEVAAKAAYMLADAMIAERDKP